MIYLAFTWLAGELTISHSTIQYLHILSILSGAPLGWLFCLHVVVGSSLVVVVVALLLLLIMTMLLGWGCDQCILAVYTQ